VLIPSLRHPMVNAAAIATLVSIAGPGRVAVGIGSGFTGRLTMGRRPMKWSEVGQYVHVLRGLLRGNEVEWEGGAMRMLHPESHGASLPIDVPFVIAAAGPKGIAVARELGDGVFGGFMPVGGFRWSMVLTLGTVFGDGEHPGSARVLGAAGHAAAVMFHAAMESRRPDIVQGGKEWAAAYEAVPQRVRHLALHDQHLVAINDRDRPFVTGEMLVQNGLALTRAAWRERIAMLESAGATEIAYQPAGPDIAKELETFASAVRA
jgi:5,10-methylenetetrahydromethanopterin reductase